MTVPTYTVQLDDETLVKATASSLADICNQVRGKAARVRIWSWAGMQLIDTKHGDAYRLIGPSLPVKKEPG